MPGLRVIAGEAKGRRLKMVPGSGTRPIADRVKQALFNILAGDVAGARVLDLFAGTGSVGIEALSRGAGHAVFLDSSKAAVETIRANLQATGLADRATVLQRDAFAYLASTPKEEFDLVYVAPPQYKGIGRRALAELDARPAWLAADSLIVVQIDPKEEEPATPGRLQPTDRRRYGNTLLLFYTLPGT
jgi:16S rRNA (guanine(966)-N(2))-methyltransferase RsmD